MLVGLVLMVWLTHPALEAVRDLVTGENAAPLLVTLLVLDLVLVLAVVALWREMRRLRAELERLVPPNVAEFPRPASGGEQRVN